MVVPSEEAVTWDGVVGGEGGRFAVEEGAAAVDIAIGVACLDDDLELFGGGEVGGEGGVLSEEYAARVVGVAVVPAEEAVAEPGHGADFDVGEVGVGAVAHGVAHERVGGRGVYIVEVGDGEEGSPTVTARMCRIVVANRRLIKISGRKTLDLKDEIAVEAYLGVQIFQGQRQWSGADKRRQENRERHIPHTAPQCISLQAEAVSRRIQGSLVKIP